MQRWGMSELRQADEIRERDLYVLKTERLPYHHPNHARWVGHLTTTAPKEALR